MRPGERVRKRRKELGISGAELGRRVGITKAHVSRIENDKGNPSETVYNAVAQALGMVPPWPRDDISFPPQRVVTEADMEHLKLWDRLPVAARRHILGLMEMLARGRREMPQPVDELAAVAVFPCSSQPPIGDHARTLAIEEEGGEAKYIQTESGAVARARVVEDADDEIPLGLEIELKKGPKRKPRK